MTLYWRFISGEGFTLEIYLQSVFNMWHASRSRGGASRVPQHKNQCNEPLRNILRAWILLKRCVTKSWCRFKVIGIRWLWALHREKECPPCCSLLQVELQWSESAPIFRVTYSAVFMEPREGNFGCLLLFRKNEMGFWVQFQLLHSVVALRLGIHPRALCFDLDSSGERT